jgi:hypothetical protein
LVGLLEGVEQGRRVGDGGLGRGGRLQEGEEDSKEAGDHGERLDVAAGGSFRVSSSPESIAVVTGGIGGVIVTTGATHRNDTRLTIVTIVTACQFGTAPERELPFGRRTRVSQGICMTGRSARHVLPIDSCGFEVSTARGL